MAGKLDLSPAVTPSPTSWSPSVRKFLIFITIKTPAVHGGT